MTKLIGQYVPGQIGEFLRMNSVRHVIGGGTPAKLKPMDAAPLDRLGTGRAAEVARTAPPPRSPAFHDIPGGRYTSDEFWELEREHLWPHAWVLAGRSE